MGEIFIAYSAAAFSNGCRASSAPSLTIHTCFLQNELTRQTLYSVARLPPGKETLARSTERCGGSCRAVSKRGDAGSCRHFSAHLSALTVHVEAEEKRIAEAIIRSGTRSVKTDTGGLATLHLPDGPHQLVVSKIGFAPATLSLTLRAGVDTTIEIELHERETELSSVMVTATRGSRRVEDEPTRVDVLGREEVEEQTAMIPGNVSRFLGETGGVQIASTSPGLGGSNVRVLGLRGRYTQLLSDGLPLYGLTTEGLGLLQISPVDLRQVELIKGAASALYGPSALGGVVNFVSRLPGPGHHREALLNQTTQGGTDATLFDARTLSQNWGYTLLASGNSQQPRDVNSDGWAEVPKYQRGVVRPRLYWTRTNGRNAFLTSGFTAENRSGGTLDGGTVPSGLPFKEARDTRRGDAGAAAHLVLGGGRVLALRGSVTEEARTRLFGLARERDRRSTDFAEAALTQAIGTQEIVLGVAFQRDGYKALDVPIQSYQFNVPALFAQHTWSPSEWFAITSSARLDAHSAYGTFVSPRISALYRATHGWSARLSAGAGTYAPTPFVEETEEIGLSKLRPLRNLSSERARGASGDVGGTVGPFELNGSIHVSVIDRAVALRAVPPSGPAFTTDSVELVNVTGPTRTTGAEAFARYRRGSYKLTGTYAYLRATEIDAETNVRRGVPLTPKHAGGFIGAWEPGDENRLAVEAFYTGQQPLTDNTFRVESRPYVMVGALAQRRFGRLVMFANGENLTNVRQSHFDPIVRPTPGLGGRWTTDAWAPLDGAVINGGMRIGF